MDTSTISACKYRLDDKGEYIVNIPFAEYLTDYVPKNGEKVFDIADFGAKEDVADNCGFIADAMKAAAEVGGVVKISGHYAASEVKMLSNTTLWIAAGACLQFFSHDDFIKRNMAWGRGFITAEGAENIKVVGSGRIAGSGMSYCMRPRNMTVMRPMKKFVLKKYVCDFLARLGQPKPGQKRPKLLYFSNSKNIYIGGLEFKDSSEWTVCLEDCEDVIVENVVINDNVRVANSDGIDVVSSRNVRIEHVFISVGDDGVVIKAHKVGNVENVFVCDAKIFSLANGFKIGSETLRDIKKIVVKDCEFFKCDTTGGYSGIAIESCDGSNVSDIDIDNITMQGEASALLIWLGNRMRYEKKDIGSISNVRISNIRAVDVDLPMAILGVKEKGNIHYVENVTLRDVSVVYRECTQKLLVKKRPFESVMKGYPDIINSSKFYFLPDYLNIFWDLPVYGMYQRYTLGLTLDNVKTKPRRCEVTRKESN